MEAPVRPEAQISMYSGSAERDAPVLMIRRYSPRCCATGISTTPPARRSGATTPAKRGARAETGRMHFQTACIWPANRPGGAKKLPGRPLDRISRRWYPIFRRREGSKGLPAQRAAILPSFPRVLPLFRSLQGKSRSSEHHVYRI